MSIKVFWVQFDYLFEQTLRFLVIVVAAGLPRLDLGKNAQCFVAILELSAPQHSGQVQLSTLKVSQVELDLRHAQVSLVVFWVELKSLLIIFVGGLEVALSVFGLAQNKAKV